jgi:hypothetical protein
MFGDMEEGKNRKKWCKTECMEEGSLAKFIVPDRGNKVDYGIVLSYRPAARLHRPEPGSLYAGVNFIPHTGTVNLSTGEEEDEEVP